MKILYPVSETTPSYGGIGAYTYKTITELIAKYKDYEAVIVTSNQRQGDTFSKYFNGVDRIKVISLFEHTSINLILRDLSFQVKISETIRKILTEEAIDIIHHQTGHYDLFFSINFLEDSPIIMTSHGDLFTILQQWKKTKQMNFDEAINYYFGRLLYYEEKYLYKKSDTIIAVADHVRNQIIDHYGIRADKIQTIHNFVDSDKFYFHPGPLNKPYNIGFIGRPYYIKGFYDLITILNKNNNKDLIEWHLVTNTEMVKKLVTNNENIHYYNSVPQSRLSEFYDMIDFMFIPSYSEACPMVVIESLMKGKYCITRDLVGIREIMKNCTGHYFHDISQVNLNEIIETVTKTSVNLYEILRKNREAIKKQYGALNLISSVYNLYKKYS